MGNKIERYWDDRKQRIERELASIVIGPSLDERWKKQHKRLNQMLGTFVKRSVQRSRLTMLIEWRFKPGSFRFSRELIQSFSWHTLVDVLFRDAYDNPSNAWCLNDKNSQPGYIALHETAGELCFEVGKPIVELRSPNGGTVYVGFGRGADASQGAYTSGGNALRVEHNGRTYDAGSIFPAACAKRWPKIVPVLLETEEVFAGFVAQWRARLRTEKLRKELSSLPAKCAAWSGLHLPDDLLLELIALADMVETDDSAAPRGLLLYGPPGTGKTLFARTLAQTTGCSFHSVTLAELKSEHVGGTGSNVVQLWRKLRSSEPAILFIDECEGVLPRRAGMDSDQFSRDLVQTFLAEWDGISGSSRIFVVGATNRRDILDDAAISRFGVEMEIGLPSAEARANILRQELKAVRYTGTVPQGFHDRTQGFSGRDLAQLAKLTCTLAHPNPASSVELIRACDRIRKRNNPAVSERNTWDTLVVDPETLAMLQVTCDLLRNAEGWQARGVAVPRGILLTGLPGVGKTQVARTVAHESGLSFIAASTGDLKGGWLGHSANNVKMLFERARASAPAVLFIDELDVVAGTRGHGVTDQFIVEIVGQLLQEMDGLKSEAPHVFVLAATNYPDKVDSAILSRLPQTIHLPLPDETSRARMLTTLLRGKPLDKPVEAISLVLAAAVGSKQWSGRDLRSWVERAEQKAVQRAILQGGPQHLTIHLQDFLGPAFASVSSTSNAKKNAYDHCEI